MNKRWIAFDPTWAGSCQERAGCYVLFCGDQVAYIGQSENVRRRIKEHRFQNKAGGWQTDMSDGHTTTPWGNWRWREGMLRGKVCYARRFGEQLMLEARLIRRLQPRLNRRGVGNGR